MQQLVEATDKIYAIPLTEIYSDDEFNCRGRIAPLDVLDLAKSIQKIGLQQPIIVQPFSGHPVKRYRIVAGHRRFKACMVVETKTINAIIKESMDEMQARLFNLEENLKRQSLNILQEAKALEHFFKDGGWTQEMVMGELSVSRGWVQARVNLLRLDEDIQQEAAAGYLTQEHIRQIAAMKTRGQREEAVRKIKNAKLAGEKRVIRVGDPKKRNAFAKKPRDREEIFVLQEIIQDNVGNSFATRCLGWAAGTVSDYEIHRDLQEFAEKQGKNYRLPEGILAELVK